MTSSENMISLTEQYTARNYHPLPVVINEAEGVWVWDVEGNKYMDLLSCYSAINQGHRHPKIIKALLDQAGRVTLTSRAFHNDKLAYFGKRVSELTGKDKMLPMNTGAEAVETAAKAARRWAYQVKGVKQEQAEIIVCSNNFHGRTMFPVSACTTESATRDYGPMLSGIKIVTYGDIEALQEAITPNTAAFLVEPIQGEGGIVVPPEGYLKQVSKLSEQENILFMADEIQTGLGRTGKMFACDWEGVTPDVYILGKALGGGVYPVACIAANEDVLGVFEPGSHGSTFGGNPLASAVAVAALDVIEEEDLADRALKLGEYLQDKLRAMNSSVVKEIRGKGLLVGMELTTEAKPYCKKLMSEGILCKETRDTVIRFASPLIINKEQLDYALEKIEQVFID